MNDFDNKQICSYKDIDRFGFTCDVCGRKVNGCHYINGMSFCEKCYQETFGKDNQQNEIQQLKQQLKEKDKEIEKLKQQYTILENENGKLTTELIMDKYKKAQKEVSFGKQLAIQELAEIERLLYESHYKEIDNKYYAEYEDINNLIDSRIKALEKEDA